MPLFKQLLFGHVLKEGECGKMLNHPVMQIADVRDSIHNPAGAEDVRIFGEQRWRDDARLVLPRLEVRVGEEEEDFRELVFANEVR